MAPSARATDGVAAATAGRAARGDRVVDAAGAADRAAIEYAGGAVASRRPAADHPRGRRRTAEAVAAVVDDPHRFRDAKAVGRFFGLVPSKDQSGDRNRLGHITREGPAVVRQLVAKATWQALRRSPTGRAYFERVRRDDPQRKKIALVTTAHYLVRVMWALLKRGTTWEEGVAPADKPKRVAPTIGIM